MQNFFPNPFSFTLETILKMAKETNKRDVKSTWARATKYTSKKVAKAEFNLNYALFWLSIYIWTMDELAYFILMFSLVLWFLYFLQYLLKIMKSKKSNRNIGKEWAKVLSFVLEKNIFYRG